MGLSREAWRKILLLGGQSAVAFTNPTVLQKAVLAAGMRSSSVGQARSWVTAVLLWANALLDLDRSAGMCEHPEESSSRDRVRQWLADWRADPDRPVEWAALW